LKPINGKLRGNEKHWFLRPRPRNRLIYELVRIWLISFGGKAHVIAQINAKKTYQNGLETTNRLKNKRGKRKSAKNTSQNTRAILLQNPGGHKEDSGPPFPLKNLILTQIQGFVNLSFTSN
jgi:hypothetical protein